MKLLRLLVLIQTLLPCISLGSDYPKDRHEIERDEMGLILNRDIVLFKSDSTQKQKKSQKNLKTRALFWKATKDVLKDIPINVSDYSSGIIITDWYISRFRPNYSFKIEVTLEGQEEGELGVRVHERKLEKNQWYNEPENEKLVLKYKQMILDRADLISKREKK